MPPTTSRRPGRRRRAPRRWVGLDAARGTTVLLATVLAVGGWAGAEVAVPRGAVGIGPFDLLPGAFLVLAGVGIGWRRTEGDERRHPPRARRRALLLFLAGGLVVAARSGGSLGAVAAEELWRLGVATGLAALLLRAPRWVAVALTPVLLAAPATLIGAGPVGRGVRALPPEAAWRLETMVGLPTGGAPLASLPGAVGLVLIGVALGVWMARRPGGPASAGALATVALWSGLATLVLGQLRAPVPVLLDLPVALAAVAAACLLLAVGHLVALLAAGSGLEATTVAVGRTAIVPVALGAALLGVVQSGWLGVVPQLGLPTLAALTLGGVASVGVVVAARRVTWKVERIAA